MTTNLQNYFPMIRTKLEVLDEIMERPNLLAIYESWDEEQQKDFLDLCTGVRGAKILYDAFFKEIMNPDTAPERLEDLLSLILKRKIHILKVLPNDSTRIADESSLLIMDIVVELDDGSIANVEVQKLGYAFPGERSACYSADLLLRQYKRVKGEKKKEFTYKDIKKVYTIILFEKSSKKFHEFPDCHIHHFSQKSDSGIKLDLLQEFVFIPLDIFRKNQQNIINKTPKTDNKLDAWLTFLSMDEPEDIIRLITEYPEFKPLYEEIYLLCRNMEQVMGIFSEELLELDRNTVQYMIDEMQDMIDAQKQEIEALKQKIAELSKLEK